MREKLTASPPKPTNGGESWVSEICYQDRRDASGVLELVAIVYGDTLEEVHKHIECLGMTVTPTKITVTVSYFGQADGMLSFTRKFDVTPPRTDWTIHDLTDNPCFLTYNRGQWRGPIVATLPDGRSRVLRGFPGPTVDDEAVIGGEVPAPKKQVEQTFKYPMTRPALSKSAWLIERSQPEGQDPPYWLSLNGWTPVASEAVKFATKDDAERKLDGISGIVGVHSPMGHVVEHVFVDAPATTAMDMPGVDLEA